MHGLFYKNLDEFFLAAFYDKTVSTEGISAVGGLDIGDLCIGNAYAALLNGTSCVGAGWSKLCLHEKCKDVEIALCKISSRKLYGRHVCGISAACKECMGCLACLGGFLLAVYQLGQLESSDLFCLV